MLPGGDGQLIGAVLDPLAVGPAGVGERAVGVEPAPVAQPGLGRGPVLVGADAARLAGSRPAPPRWRRGSRGPRSRRRPRPPSPRCGRRPGARGAARARATARGAAPRATAARHGRRRAVAPRACRPWPRCGPGRRPRPPRPSATSSPRMRRSVPSMPARRAASRSEGEAIDHAAGMQRSTSSGAKLKKVAITTSPGTAPMAPSARRSSPSGDPAMPSARYCAAASAEK